MPRVGVSPPRFLEVSTNVGKPTDAPPRDLFLERLIAPSKPCFSQKVRPWMAASGTATFRASKRSTTFRVDARPDGAQ